MEHECHAQAECLHVRYVTLSYSNTYGPCSAMDISGGAHKDPPPLNTELILVRTCQAGVCAQVFRSLNATNSKTVFESMA